MLLKIFLFSLLVHNINCYNIQSLLVKPAPFNTDEESMSERNACDYNIKITQEMAYANTAPRKIRVYADGIYDMFHWGHSTYLMQVKNLFPNIYLITGVCNDKLTHDRKGMTVMTEDERYEAIRHCRYVDEVLKDAPWEIDDQFLIDNKIDFVTHESAPYLNENGQDIYKPLKDKGMFIGVERYGNTSTSDIISRIVRDYDTYIRRNLKRGYKAKDLNISYMKEKQIEIQDKIDEMNGTVSKTKEDIMNQWESTRKDLADSYLSLFGHQGRVIKYWNQKKDILNSILKKQK